jgi:PAS domain S-box-containing protein
MPGSLAPTLIRRCGSVHAPPGGAPPVARTSPRANTALPARMAGNATCSSRRSRSRRRAGIFHRRHRAEASGQALEAALAEQNQARLAALNQMEDANAARQLAVVAAAALQESQARLQVLIDHAPAALAMFDREMRYLAVSQRWRDDYGLDGRDLLGHSHYEIFPEIGEAWKAVHRRGLAGETITADEDRFERPDGRVQWLRWEVRPWHAADGTVGGIVIFSEDITQRKQASEALAPQRREARTTSSISRPPSSSSMRTAASSTTTAGRKRSSASSGRGSSGILPRSTGCPRICGTRGAGALPAHSGRRRAVFRNPLAAQGPHACPVEMLDVMRLPDGTVISEVRDITERKVAEEALRQALAEQQRGAPGGAEPDGGRPGGAPQCRGGGGLAAQAVDGRRAKPGEHRHHQPRC